MFRKFFWKVFICVVPLLLALWAIWVAYRQESFRLGVDLVGGTILVYEIDMHKLTAEEGREKQDPVAITKNLAEKLKNRIDPNDLKNVTIRPAGGEGRVEIILPTGGHAKAEEHQKRWDELLRNMEAKYKLQEGDLKVPRGQIMKLTEKILQLVQERIWEEKLFNTVERKKELMLKALDPTVTGTEEPQFLRPLFDVVTRDRDALVASGLKLDDQQKNKVMLTIRTILEKDGWKPGADLPDQRLFAKQVSESLFDPSKSLSQLMAETKQYIDDNRKNRDVESWLKQQAWRTMVGMMLEQWPILKERKIAFLGDPNAPKDKPRPGIAPGAIEELVGRATCKGDSIGQAFLTAMESWTNPPSASASATTQSPAQIGGGLLSNLYTDNIGPNDKSDDKFLNANAILKFVDDNYGPSAQIVEQEIDKAYKSESQTRDLTVEDVQQIKELVQKVGSLEFRVLANNVDDKAAIAEAKAMLDGAASNPDLKRELDDAQAAGLPPPPPRVGNTKFPKQFDIKLKGGDSRVTYSWVELGPQERTQLGLNNAALEEGKPHSWSEMAKYRNAGQAGQISAGSDQKVMQGALFYSRTCQDRNMPEEERRRKKYEYFVLTRNPEIDPGTGQETPKIDGRYLVSAANHPDNSGRPAVSFRFNNTGGQLFRELTRKNVKSGEGSTSVNRYLAIILDGLMQSAATINSEISTDGQISGSFTNREVDNLVNILRSGALPATLKQQPVSENTMGATLGQDTISKGLWAIGISFVVVLAFMIVYYRFAGLVASVALLANLILTVGFMVAVQATFTLPGLAGLVLMLGMAVDANILIYERLREERDKGASILLALRNGYDRALPTIIDTHLSSIFTAIVLYIVGNDQLKGFGVSLTVGLLISLFTSLFMTRLIFDFWAAMGWLKKLSMLRFFSKPDIDFMSIRYYLFIATGVLTILGGALFIGRLPDDLDIDFVGGTAYSGQLTEAKNIEELRDLLNDKNQKTLLKARVEVKDENTNRYMLSYDTGLSGATTTPREVVLANRPEGNTPQERALNVQKRASELPDWAVEQIFLSDAPVAESKENKSRFFTVRTTEKEPDLVQATLDRLMQGKDGNTLLQQVIMKFDAPDQNAPLKSGRETRVQFFKKGKAGSEDVLDSASPSFVSTLLTRQLLDAFGEKERDKLPITFELNNDDAAPSGDGRFKQAVITFAVKAGSADLKPDDVAKINKALTLTKSEFERRPQPERLENFDSQLAAEIRLRAMYAILLSWAAILLYLWFRFGSWTFGLAAVLCLIHDLFFTLGVIALCHYVNRLFPGFLGIEDFKINLPAVAALLTLVGYSVNDTIVVFDRIREVRGKNPELTAQMINDSVNQTLSRTLLASLATWLVVIVLYVAGGPGVHLFAFVMVVGVVVGTYSSIYVASPLLLLFGEGSKSSVRLPTPGPMPTERGPDVRIQPATP